MVADWQVISRSVRGATHLQNNKPNQDALGVYQAAQGLPLIVALADGHGGEKYTHSDMGAKFAVKAAIEVLKNTFKNPADFSLTQIKRLTEHDIPKAIVRSWREKIEVYNQAQHLKSDAQYRIFGSTLLVCLLLPECIVYWQLGDGDILNLDCEAQLYRPLTKDPQLLGNETTSLCGDKPWLNFRSFFQPITDKQPPCFMMLSTDGYSNAYLNDAEFETTVRDIAKMLETEGSAWVKQQLPDWLSEASQQGSGDDISVVIVWRKV